MALVGSGSSDPSDFDEQVLEAIRAADKPHSWGNPKVPHVGADEQRAKRERFEELHAAEKEAHAQREDVLLALAGDPEAAQRVGLVDDEVTFVALLEGAVAAKASEVPLLPTNPWNPDRAGAEIRREERIRADERERIAAEAEATKQAATAEEPVEPDHDYFANIDSAPAEVEDDVEVVEEDDWSLDAAFGGQFYSPWADEEDEAA